MKDTFETLGGYAPEPWVNDGLISGAHQASLIKTKDNGIIAMVWSGNKIDGQLIAAAPSLLAACREMIKHLTETDFDVCGTSDADLNRWIDIVKKAIS